MDWLQQLYGMSPFFIMYPWAGWVFAIGLIWSLFWKGFALWHAAKKDDTAWFIAILILNTLGVLEILYLFVFARDKKYLLARSK